MLDWYATLIGIQVMFLIVATVGSVVFLFQLVMMFVGGDGGDDPADGPEIGDGDTDMDGDVDGDGGHVDSDTGFRLLSIQSVSVFLMMFGLVGLAFSKGGKYSAVSSLAISIGVGLVFMYLVAKMFSFFKTLQSSGTLNLKNAIGKEARVYLTISENETGQIEVNIQNHLGIYDAKSVSGDKISTDSRVKVVNVVNSLMIVEKLD